MNFRQIDCFLAVGNTLSFSAAAKLLYLSQSTVSAQVIALERELGFDLFERDRHHVRLTKAGDYLLSHWSDIRKTFDQSVNNARELSNNGRDELRLGYDGPLSECWIGEAIALFRQQNPHVNLTLRRKPIGKLTEMLVDDALDAAITVRSEATSAQLSFRALREGAACVYIAKGHRLAHKERVMPNDLRGERVISPYAAPIQGSASGTASILIGHGLDMSNAVLSEDGDTTFMEVQANMGVFVASHLCDEFAERYEVASVEFDAGLEPAVLGLAWRKDIPLIDSLFRCIQFAVR